MCQDRRSRDPRNYRLFQEQGGRSERQRNLYCLCIFQLPSCYTVLTSHQLMTNGSNIPGLWQFACSNVDGMIDEDGIYSNDIYAILCSYGVEAARATILREIGGVFAVYKIDVDIRHLELIADYMVSFRRFPSAPVLITPRPNRPLTVDTNPLIGKAYRRIHRLCSRHHMRRPRRSSPMPRCTGISMICRRHLAIS